MLNIFTNHFPRVIKIPLILCPTCNRITYAYLQYNEDNEITSYRCSLCYNVFNIDQVNVIPFPNEEIVLNTTFANIVSEIDKVDVDELLRNHRPIEIAEKFLYCLLFLARPRELRLYRNRHGFIEWYFAQWDYRGTREAEEYNEEELEKAQMRLADAVDKYYVIIEIREIDEGDSIFIAVHPDDVELIIQILKPYSIG